MHVPKGVGRVSRRPSDEAGGRVSDAVWLTRRRYEAGLIDLPEVEVPALPAEAHACAHAIYDDAVLLARCRFSKFLNAPFPMTRNFMPGWCSVDERTVRLGVPALVEWGVFRRDEDILIPRREGDPAGGDHVAHTYLPVGITRAPGWVSNLPPERQQRHEEALPPLVIPDIYRRVMTRAVADMEATPTRDRGAIAGRFVRRYGGDLAPFVPHILRMRRAQTLARALVAALAVALEADAQTPEPAGAVSALEGIAGSRGADEEATACASVDAPHIMLSPLEPIPAGPVSDYPETYRPQGQRTSTTMKPTADASPPHPEHPPDRQYRQRIASLVSNNLANDRAPWLGITGDYAYYLAYLHARGMAAKHYTDALHVRYTRHLGDARAANGIATPQEFMEATLWLAAKWEAAGLSSPTPMRVAEDLCQWRAATSRG